MQFVPFEDELVDHLTKLKQPEEFEVFLDEFLTFKERNQLALRLKIVKLLKLGFSHRAISLHLDTSVATILRGSKGLQEGRYMNVSAT